MSRALLLASLVALSACVPAEEPPVVGAALPVVKTGGGLYIELQGTAEALPFGREALNRLLDLADTGTRQLFALQRSLVGQYLGK